MVELPVPCREAFFSISATLFSVVEDWYFVSCAATRGLEVSGRKVLVRPGHLGDSSKSPERVFTMQEAFSAIVHDMPSTRVRLVSAELAFTSDADAH